MIIACEHGLVFNKDKCTVKTDHSIFGCASDITWAHPDPEKVSAVHKMLAPGDNNLTTKVPQIGNLPVTLHTLTLLLHCTPKWAAEERNRILSGITLIMKHLTKSKLLICKDTTLQYFDIHMPVTVQVNASKKGLGVALHQDGCPVALTSKALTPVKQLYANIECELITCVFGAEWFNTYVFGHAFTIESDHKPLEQINIKNPADTPVHLQRMLLWLQNYDVTIKDQPGKEMLVADALSHYAPLKAPKKPLDITTNHVHITPDRITEFQTLIQDCPLLCSLAEMSITGWPDDINDVSHALHPYHGHRNILTVEDGPHPLRWSSHHSSIRKWEDHPTNTWRTHGNQQVPKQSQTLCVYWPGINSRHQTLHWIMPNMPTSLPTGTTTATSSQ